MTTVARILCLHSILAFPLILCTLLQTLVKVSGINTMNATSIQETNTAQICWSVVFSIVTCAIIVSNSLTLTVFIKTSLQRMRKRTHYVLISLTCADLSVGCLACPLFIWDLTKPGNQRGSKTQQAVYNVIDIISGFASILSLAAIAIERLIAVRWPLRHRSANKSFYVILVLTPWLTAVCIAVLYILGIVLDIIPKLAVSVTVVVSITSALVIIAASYELVRKRVRRRNWRPHTPILDRERNLTHTLMTITLVSLITWLPFEVLLIVFHFCKVCSEPFYGDWKSVNLTFKLFQFSNSFLNTLFYTLRIPEYKKTLFLLLKQPWRREMALPADKKTSARLTSFKKYIRSPMLPRRYVNSTDLSLDNALRYVGNIPSDVIVSNSPLLVRRLHFL